MENVRGRRWTGQRTSSRLLIYEDLQPNSVWNHYTESHVLHVDLPGFKKEEVKIELDNLGKIIISGERRLGENRYSRFKQVLDVPLDSDINNFISTFQGGILIATVPKIANEIKEKQKQEHQSAEGVKEDKKQETSDAEGKPKKDDNEIREKLKGGHQTVDEIEIEKKQETPNTEEKPKKEERDEKGRIEGLNGKREKNKEKIGLKDVAVGLMWEVLAAVLGLSLGMSKDKREVSAALLGLLAGLYISYGQPIKRTVRKHFNSYHTAK